MSPATKEEATALIARLHEEERLRKQANDMDMATDAALGLVSFVFWSCCLVGALYGLVKFIKWAWES
jgi:hypothetical protein